MRLFAGDPAVLGRDVDLDGRKFTIVGVLRQEFAGLDDYPKDLWIPLSTYAELVRPDILGANQSRRGQPAAPTIAALHHGYPFVIGMFVPLAMGLPIILPQALTGPRR